jgi:hypothetical protein
VPNAAGFGELGRAQLTGFRACRSLGGAPGNDDQDRRITGFRRAAGPIILNAETPRRARRGALQWYREALVLNRFDPHSPSAGEAEVKYLDGDFRVLRPGAFVRCAVTGTPIPLEELKYWSVERQEAYAGPDAVLKRLHPMWAG